MANKKSVHDFMASHRVDTWHFQAFSVFSSAFEGATVIEKMEFSMVHLLGSKIQRFFYRLLLATKKNREIIQY